eukprot:410465-Ditylum_brightwellii.AAC.1
MTFIKNLDTGRLQEYGRYFADLVKELDLDKEQTFGIYEKAEEGTLHVWPGVFGSTDSYNVKLEK